MPQDLTPFHGTPCLNCGSELTGNFCAECGQRATDTHLSVKVLVVEFVESLFSLEFGFWQTFKRMVFFPGQLTAEYIAGRRKRYSSPIRLYLATSLIFFFLISFLGETSRVNVTDDEGNTTVLTGQEAKDALREGFNDALGDAESDSTLAEVFGDVPGGEALTRVMRDPDGAERRFMTYLPRAMFLMVPISALLFRFVYVRHKRPYLHYLVFSLHLHALFYLTASIAGLVGRIQPEPVGDSLALLLLLTFPVNAVRGQRRAFGDSWWKAALKAGIVWHVYGIFLGLVITGVIAAMVFLG